MFSKRFRLLVVLVLALGLVLTGCGKPKEEVSDPNNVQVNIGLPDDEVGVEEQPAPELEEPEEWEMDEQIELAWDTPRSDIAKLLLNDEDFRETVIDYINSGAKDPSAYVNGTSFSGEPCYRVDWKDGWSACVIFKDKYEITYLSDSDDDLPPWVIAELEYNYIYTKPGMERDEHFYTELFMWMDDNGKLRFEVDGELGEEYKWAEPAGYSLFLGDRYYLRPAVDHRWFYDSLLTVIDTQAPKDERRYGFVGLAAANGIDVPAIGSTRWSIWATGPAIAHPFPIYEVYPDDDNYVGTDAYLIYLDPDDNELKMSLETDELRDKLGLNNTEGLYMP